MPPEDNPRPASSARRRAPALVACSLLLLLFAGLAYSSARTNSVTFDEPLHLVGGFTHRFFNDWRINPEDPAFLGHWAALALTPDSLEIDRASQPWNNLPGPMGWSWLVCVQALHQSPGYNTDDSVVNRSRATFIVLGVLLGVLTGWWTRRLAGGLAAVVALGLFCLDPNFLAHSALIKNDVPMALLWLAGGYTLWRFGQSGSWWRLALLALVCGLAVGTKFSGILLGPVILIALLLRALMNVPWRVLGLDLKTRAARLLAVPVVVILLGLCSWGILWAAYGFRFAPTAHAQLHPTQDVMNLARAQKHYLRTQEWVPPGDSRLASEPYPLLPRVIVWAEGHRLLPQTWLFGFLYTYATTLVRKTYLLGEIRIVGWWYYFPLAMVVKTPLTTLLAGGIAVMLAARHLLRGAVSRIGVGRGRSSATMPESLPPAGVAAGAVPASWTWLCLSVPPVLYLAAAMSSGFNLGLRHILPVYPYVFIGVAVAAGSVARGLPDGRRPLLVGAVLALLALETLPQWPTFLPFFNLAAGGREGGVAFLSDSNIDWGQDLKRLAHWRRQNPKHPLYLAYFGAADPRFYVPDARLLPGTMLPFLPIVSDMQESGYLAISVTHLQGTNLPEETQDLYRRLLDPDYGQYVLESELGGGIYVYRSTRLPPP